MSGGAGHERRAAKRPSSVGRLGALLVLAAGCADATLPAARDAVARATQAETEAEALQPLRADQLLYRMPLNQARAALADGHGEDARHLADKAYEAAVSVRDRRLHAKEAVGVRLKEIEELAQAARDDSDPGLDKEGLFREVQKRWLTAKERYTGLDYEAALQSADEAVLLLKRRGHLFRKPLPVLPPESEDGLATPSPGGGAVESGTPDTSSAPKDEGSFFDRLKKAVKPKPATGTN